MELCNYSEWLTLRAITKSSGLYPDKGEYAGLLDVWTGHRTSLDEVSVVIQKVLDKYRAAIAKAKGSPASL